MEIVRIRGVNRFGTRQREDFIHVNSALPAVRNLHTASRHQEGFADNGQALALEVLFFYKKVRNAGFVLQGDEAMALCGSRALAADDQSPYPYRRAVPEALQILGIHQPQLRMTAAPELHRVRAGGGALDREV